MAVDAVFAPLSNLPRLSTRRSLTDAVHDLLRDAITDGTLEPGTRLREVIIARQLDVSATPVREALRRLGEAGLVETSPHRGASVVSVSPADLVNLYEIHEVLESYAVSSAARRFSRWEESIADRDGAVDSIGALISAMDSVVTNADQSAFNRLDLAFHRQLNGLGGNDLMTDEIEQIHRRIQSARIRFEVHLPDRPARSQVQHRELLSTIVNGNAAAALALAKEHIHAVRDVVVALLREDVPATHHHHPA